MGYNFDVVAMWVYRIALVFSLLPLLAARRLPIRTYTTADGLARDRVQCIVQDRRGFMWFCTREGLSRFDGYRFLNYGTDQGLPSANVSALLAGNNGIYWAGTPAGVCRFDPGSRSVPRFRCYTLPGDNRSQVVFALLEDRDSTIWCGTEGGLFRLPDRAEAFQRVVLDQTAAFPAIAVEALFEDRRGALWVSTRGGLFRRDPDGRVTPRRNWLDHPAHPMFGTLDIVLAMLEDREGRLWLGTTDRLVRIDGSDRVVEFLSGPRVFSLLQSSTGIIWAGTSSGLAEYIPGPGQSKFELYDASNGVSGGQIETLAEDRDGNLWIGSDGGGVMKLAPGGFVTHYAEDGLGELRPYWGSTTGAIFETLQGELCYSHGALVSRFDGRRFVSTRPAFPPDITYFGWGAGRTALQDHAGEWWIATGQGLSRFPAVSFRQLAKTAPKAVYRTADGLLNNNIFQLFEDSRGDIWISTIGGDGIALWERGSGRIHTFSEADGLLPVSAATGFAEDRAGNIWAGCYHGGLARFAKGRFTMFTDDPGVSKGGQKWVFVDSAGRLWVSARPGFARADNPAAERPLFVSYTTAQGLSSNDTYGVTEDTWGHIYVATGRGVDRFEPRSTGIGAIRHYTSADGLPLGEPRTAYRDRKGNIWFASSLGLSQLSPVRDSPPNPPPVLVTGLEIGAAPYPIADVGEFEVHGPKVRSGGGPLAIDFVGLSFAPGETLRYQYQLAGVDPEWSAPTDQRTVVYGRLSAGDYRFLVRAVNREGMTSPQPASVVFTILPPVWLSWWFLAGAALTTAALAYVAHRYRVRQLLAVERVRTRIATDLHDDIGSSLSQVSILSELVRRRLNTGDPHIAQPLAEIALVSSEMVASLSDIVWAINPRHDHLGDLTARMRRFAFDVLGARGIELCFKADDHSESLHTSPDFRRQVYLIFKEAINNSARHAKCTRADVDLQVLHGCLRVHFVDNGSGFESSSLSRGNGLANMRRRAADLGGELSVSSEPGHGTELKLSVPLRDSRTT